MIKVSKQSISICLCLSLSFVCESFYEHILVHHVPYHWGSRVRYNLFEEEVSAHNLAHVCDIFLSEIIDYVVFQQRKPVIISLALILSYPKTICKMLLESLNAIVNDESVFDFSVRVEIAEEIKVLYLVTAVINTTMFIWQNKTEIVFGFTFALLHHGLHNLLGVLLLVVIKENKFKVLVECVQEIEQAWS